MKTAIPLPITQIQDLCRKFDVAELYVFGSVLRDDFRPDSDIDFMATFRNDDLGPWMGKFFRFRDELSDVVGRRADVVEKASVISSQNPIKKRSILESAETLFEDE